MFRLGPNPDAVPKGAIDHFARSISRPGRLTAGLNYYRANLIPGTGWSAFAHVSEVGAPTVLLWGDQDPALGRLQAEGTAKHMTGEFKLEVLEGAGHWLQFERPAEVNRSLVDFASNK
jgi:pimeloyl-ACP methyl ester carboxylesterase